MNNPNSNAALASRRSVFRAGSPVPQVSSLGTRLAEGHPVPSPATASPKRLIVLLLLAGALAIVASLLWMHRGTRGGGTTVLRDKPVSSAPAATQPITSATVREPVSSSASNPSTQALVTEASPNDFIYKPSDRSDPMSPLMVPAAPVVTEASGAIALAPAAPGATADAPELQLSGIVWSADSPLALVNGKIVRPGNRVAGATVSRITRTEVFVERDGRSVVLSLDPLSGHEGDEP